jgi:hypothetical protein
MKSFARISSSILIPPIIIILNLSLLISNIDSFHLRALNFHHHHHHHRHLRCPTSFTTFLNHDEEYARSTITHNDKIKMMAKASATSTTKSATAIANDGKEDLHNNDDYLVIDSLHVSDEDRPSLIETLKNPRDGLALLCLVPIAGTVSLCNIFGIYTLGQLYTNLEIASIVLGILSGLVTFLQLQLDTK